MHGLACFPWICRNKHSYVLVLRSHINSLDWSTFLLIGVNAPNVLTNRFKLGWYFCKSSNPWVDMISTYVSTESALHLFSVGFIWPQSKELSVYLLFRSMYSGKLLDRWMRTFLTNIRTHSIIRKKKIKGELTRPTLSKPTSVGIKNCTCT